MQRTLKIAQARHVLENMIFRCAEALDAGDLESLAELFTYGCIKTAINKTVTGPEEVLQIYASVIQFYDADEQLVPYARGQCTPRTRHFTSNLIFEFDNAVQTAEVRSVFSVTQTLDGQPALLCDGRYVDTFLHTRRGWHFDERQIIIDHQGDMSRHLLV